MSETAYTAMLHKSGVVLMLWASRAKAGWQQTVLDEFEQSCRGSGPGKRCAPKASKIVEVLMDVPADVNRSDGEFPEILHSLTEQFASHPLAWKGLSTLLNPKQPWTSSFCTYSSRILQLLQLMTPLPMTDSISLKDNFPASAALYDQWFNSLRNLKSEKIQALMRDFEAADAESHQYGSLRTVTFARLHQYVHATLVARHLLNVSCKSTGLLELLIEYRDPLGRNVFHKFVGSVGNTALANVLIDLLRDSGVGLDVVNSPDNYGYSPADYAKTANFLDTAKVLDDVLKESGHTEVSAVPNGAPRPWSAGLSTPREICSQNDGGWSTAESGHIPSDWMPPMEALCSFDSVDAHSFDLRTFITHYLLQDRPLLVRGGARMEERVQHFYSRKELLNVAGSRKLPLFRLPYADQYTHDKVKPVVKTLSDYVSYISGRKDVTKDLLYTFIKVPAFDMQLEFTRRLPMVLGNLSDYLELGQHSTQFYIGGELMGSPLHFHTSAVNSLIHGRKLWFLQPPAQQVWSNEVIYEHALRTAGLPEATKCLQEPGDFLFVPTGWTHGAICLTDCVGVAHELVLENVIPGSLT